MAVLKKLNKKKRKLSAFFLRFLLEAVLSVVLTGIVWLILLFLSIRLHIMLRRLFPDIETVGLIVLFLMLILNLTFVIKQNSGRLAKELLILQNAADQIREQNLDFKIAKTGIREFNQVADSLDALRTELSRSLEEQWSMQQQKKRQFAALAHDIKTPLTIVRGNAELLSETELDMEQTSYNQFILKNAEQIQSYVTKIIETTKENIPDENRF